MINALALAALLQAPINSQTKPLAPKVQIKDDVVGKGAAIKEGDVVSVDLLGTLNDGTEFDSTAGKDPLIFIVGAGEVSKGLDQGIVGMREGGKRELIVPPALGYGEKGLGPIPANSTLHFSVSLIKIEPTIQVQILTKGKGDEAKLGDIASVNFSGGVQGKTEIFNSKLSAKEPLRILIGERTLPIGFALSLKGMKEGEIRKVVIPSDLAYGKVGVPKTDVKTKDGEIKAGSVIPPGSTMEFTFELVKLEHPAA